MKYIVTVQPPKRLDNLVSDDFGNAVLALIDAGVSNLVVDMDQTSYLSSAGVRALLLISRRLIQTGGTLVLACCRPEVIKVMQICGVQNMARFATTLEGASTMLREQAAGPE
jgi:anti-anti-sigma factor